jgi:hypothetical protein
MPLEFGDDFCAACEPIARIWHKGNDPIRRRPIVTIVALDVHLPEVNSSEHLHDSHTHNISSIEGALFGNEVVSTRKTARYAHVEIPKMESFRMRERRNGERLEQAWTPEDPPITPHELVYFYPILPPSPRLGLSHCSAVYPLRWVCSTSLHASPAWHL